MATCRGQWYSPYFPPEVLSETQLVNEETALYRSRRANLEESISGLEQALVLVQQELAMTEPLVAKVRRVKLKFYV